MLRSSPPLRLRSVGGTDCSTVRLHDAPLAFHSDVGSRVHAMLTYPSETMLRVEPKL